MRYSLGLCYHDSGETENCALSKQEVKRQQHLKTIQDFIKSLENYKDFFVETLKKKNIENPDKKYKTLNIYYQGEYDYIEIHSKLEEDGSIQVTTTVDRNKNTYAINSKEKNKIPKNAFQYRHSVELSKLPEHIAEIERIRAEQHKRQMDFHVEIFNKFDKHNILVNYYEFNSIPYRGSNPMNFWESGCLDFKIFKIRNSSWVDN